MHLTARLIELERDVELRFTDCVLHEDVERAVVEATRHTLVRVVQCRVVVQAFT